MHLELRKIGNDCGFYLSNPFLGSRDNLEQSPEGFVQHVGKPGVLQPNTIKKMSEPVKEAILKGHYAVRNSLAHVSLAYHASKTHDYIDTLRQCRLVAVGIKDPRAIQSACHSVIFLHLLDDIQEAGLIPIHRFLDYLQMIDVDGRGSLPSIKQVERNYGEGLAPIQTLRALHQNYHVLVRSLPKDRQNLRRRMYLYGLNRMFSGAYLFAEDEARRERNRERVAHIVRGDTVDHHAVYQLISSLPPLFVAFTVNSLFEVVEAFREDILDAYVIQLENLLYGPIVNAHNVAKEIENESRDSSSVPTLELIETSLQRVKETIASLSQERDKAVILSRLPWTLESFAKVLSPELKRAYMEIVLDPRLRPYLKDWTDAELEELKIKLNI